MWENNRPTINDPNDYYENRHKYLEYLMKQMREAVGIDIKDNNISLDKLFSLYNDWILQRHDCGRKYLCLLNDLGLFTNIPLTYEIGKGRDDIITKDMDTKFITSFYGEPLNVNPNRIILSRFYVFREQPTLVKINRNKFELTTVNKDEKITCMTQNPYTIEHIFNWEQLHNSGNSNIIVGVYGNTFDKDRMQKINQLRTLRNRLINGTFREEQAIYGDTYCYVIASDEKVKRLTKIKTR